MKTEITKFVEYTAKRFLDGILFNGNHLRVSEEFDGSDIYSDLKTGQTRNLLFNNMEQFNVEFNKLVHNRIDYLYAEGFLTIEDGSYRALTEEELEDFTKVE